MMKNKINDLLANGNEVAISTREENFIITMENLIKNDDKIEFADENLGHVEIEFDEIEFDEIEIEFIIC